MPTHDDFVTALAAIAAALGPAVDDHYGEEEDWALAYDGNDADYVRKTWDSITTRRSAGMAAMLEALLHGDAQDDFAQSVDEANAAIPETPIERMLNQYVWVGALGRYNDTESGGFLGGRVQRRTCE